MNTTIRNTTRLLGAALRTLLVMSVICGVIYPLAVMGIGQGLFHHQANGSEITSNGTVVGSSLIGQRYDLPLKDGQETPEPDLKWFQPRPSNGLGTNTVNTHHQLLLSGATNRAGDNPELIKWVKDAKAAVINDNSVEGYRVKPSDVPPDAVTSSGSGLDPAISPQYADLQVHRIAKLNNLTVPAVQKLVNDHKNGRTLGFIGEPTVNVLELNTALKALAPRP